MFRFPNQTLKLKARDQPQSAAEESLLTRDITQLLVQRFVFFIKIESNSRFSKTYSEIESTWPINSSKEEIVCRVIVKIYLRNILWQFLIKIESK